MTNELFGRKFLFLTLILLQRFHDFHHRDFKINLFASIILVISFLDIKIFYVRMLPLLVSLSLLQFLLLLAILFFCLIVQSFLSPFLLFFLQRGRNLCGISATI